MMKAIPELDKRGLRQFGLMLAAVLAGVFGLLLPWLRGWELLPNPYWLGASVVIALWAAIAPASMNGLYRGWMRVALAIGEVINHIILAIVYFLVIMPMGIIMRALGKDPLKRTFDAKAESYRVASKQADKKHMERPF